MNKLIKIVIVGTGGFGREVLCTLQDCNKKSKKYKVLGFVDDDKSKWNTMIHNFPVVGGVDWFSKKKAFRVSCVVAVGDSKIRQKIVRKLEKMNVKFETIIHPSVICSKNVSIGEGTVIQAGNIITVDIEIGNYVHMNIDCTIGHDSKIKDFVTINPGTHISGNNLIQTGAYIGTGAISIQGIRIGKWSTIGAGTVLIDDVPDHSLYVGVPGKFKKKLN